MNRDRFRNVSVPKALVEQIEPIIFEGTYGYTSIANFIQDAIRRRLEEIKKVRT
jgi:metal-responsive CopG/Arc/MetJ family transcriptional regulator